MVMCVHWVRCFLISRMSFMPIPVDSSVYNRISQYYCSLSNKGDDPTLLGPYIRESISPSELSEKKIKGQWTIEESKGTSKMVLTLSFEENNELTYLIDGLLDGDGLMINFTMNVSSAKWSVNGGYLIIDESDINPEVTINDFSSKEMGDLDDETRELYSWLLKYYIENSTDDISATEFLGGNHILVNDLRRNKIVLYVDGDYKTLYKDKKVKYYVK